MAATVVLSIPTPGGAGVSSIACDASVAFGRLSVVEDIEVEVIEIVVAIDNVALLLLLLSVALVEFIVIVVVDS